jgi:hypothetical protein
MVGQVRIPRYLTATVPALPRNKKLRLLPVTPHVVTALVAIAPRSILRMTDAD